MRNDPTFMIDSHSRGDLNCYLDQLVIYEKIMTSASGAITLKRRLPSFWSNLGYELRLFLLGDFCWCCPLGLGRFNVVVIALPLRILEINGQLTFSNDFFTQPLAMK